MKLVVVKIGKNVNLGNFMPIEKNHFHLKIPFFKHEIKIFVLKNIFFRNFMTKKSTWKIRERFVVSDIMSTRPGRSGLVANEKIESSGLYSAVYLVPGGASSSYSGDCSLDDCEEEGKPLLSSSEITSDSIKRNKMAENAPKTTPGLNETVQEFKAREDRDPEGLNSDVRVSSKYFYDKNRNIFTSFWIENVRE